MGQFEHSIDDGVDSCGELTLILGGARSGKSRLGEAVVEDLAAKDLDGRAIYIATAQAYDAEMTQRIATHRERRGDLWRTEEIPLNLAPALLEYFPSDTPILVDCLTLWLSNILLAERDVEAEFADLIDILPQRNAPLVMISNETGLGIVPDNALARRFRDLSGIMNQAIAKAADNVLFVAAGLPLVMKGRNPAPLSQSST